MNSQTQASTSSPDDEMTFKVKIQYIMKAIEVTLTKIQEIWDTNSTKKTPWPKGRGSILHPNIYDNVELLKRKQVEFGSFTLNPETQLLSFDKMNPKILDITTEKWYADLADKSIANATKEILKHYGATHYLPGLEYFKYLSNLPLVKVPNGFKDVNLYFLFIGSTFRVSDGDSYFPVLVWDSHGFNLSRDWLGNGWNAVGRFVLLPRP